jgi:hypothetical protein
MNHQAPVRSALGLETDAGEDQDHHSGKPGYHKARKQQ